MCPHAQQARRTSRPTYVAAQQDPASLSPRQLHVLAAAIWRELTWGLTTVQREVRQWRALARKIPTLAIRHDALIALNHKRGHIDGAALFSILPAARNPSLLRLLVAYEIIWDFLDCVNEHGVAAGLTNGERLHLALQDALDPNRPIADYYRHHPWKDDGGYLRGLVNSCRASAANLPSFSRVRPALMLEATRAQVLALNHELDPRVRDHRLRTWASRELPACQEATWFELTGAASASLTVHALLTLTAEPSLSRTDITRVHDAYFPWISATTTMLDSYVDQTEDATNGDHSYIAHYPTPTAAVERIPALIQRSLSEAAALPAGNHHVLIVACMIAMYLSKDSARQATLRSHTAAFVRAGGLLTSFLLPILRLWRVIYAQCSTS